MPLDPQMRQSGSEAIAVSRYRIESVVADQKDGGLRIGRVGQTTYRATSSDLYFKCVMQMLAGFALYSGIGVQTATGMGQARRIEWGKREKSSGDTPKADWQEDRGGEGGTF